MFCDINATNWEYERNKDKILNLQCLCRDAKTIIEIGINACHSLLLMLLTNPSAEYLLFDLGIHTYTVPILDYLKNAFLHTKITCIFGDSTRTIPIYLRDNPDKLNRYDLCHFLTKFS